MPYDEKLTLRVRDVLNDTPRVEEKRMMGGLTFMVNKKMCVGILNEELMVRLAPEEYEAALERPGCREMNFTGRPMKGFVFVGPDGTKSSRNLQFWINLALAFNKRAKASKKKK
jgi:TfoX/Sxy family transcriptional regulator of competence genes